MKNECLYCGKVSQHKFCNKEHKFEYENKYKYKEEIPITKNRDKMSDKETNMINKFLEKRHNVKIN